MKRRKVLNYVLRPVAVVLAAAYFIFDLVVLSVLKPVLRRLARLKFLRVIEARIEALGPYSTLAVFLIPLILLEPLKPVSAYVIASGYFATGILILFVGEALKITIVERIFHIGQPKLMTIHAFARTYNFVVGWLTWVQALPPWRAVKRNFAAFVQWARRLKLRRERPHRGAASSAPQ